MAVNSSKTLTLLDTTTITTAVTGTIGTALGLPADCKYLLLDAKFTYGSGGTSAKFWVQTRVAGGTWRDIANFAFTTSSSEKWSAVSVYVALAAARTASDAALADDTILDGFIGDELRIKYTTTGTYADSTTIKVTGNFKS